MLYEVVFLFPMFHVVFVTVFFGNCVIFHHSCIENCDHSFEFPNAHCCKQCCGELFVYVVQKKYILGVRFERLNVGFSLGCVDFFSFQVASCVPKLPLS